MSTHTDTERLDWLMAAVCIAADGDEGASKTERMAIELAIGKRGREAIDAAMEAQ